jgi:hypothetical protein
MRDLNARTYDRKLAPLQSQFSQLSVYDSNPTSTRQHHPSLIAGAAHPNSNQTMATLRNLPKSGAVVLFTPVLTPAAPAAGKATNKTTVAAVDPFEILGRALSTHHARIRHVPYVPTVGFTETHDAFLSQADAVIIVICEPMKSKHDGVQDQVKFAKAAHEAMGYFGGPVKDPLALVQCGDADGSWWPDEIARFDLVLKCGSLDATMAQHIARKIFGLKK